MWVSHARELLNLPISLPDRSDIRCTVVAYHPTTPRMVGFLLLSQHNSTTQSPLKCLSRTNRHLSFCQATSGPLLCWGFGERAIRSALTKRGYSQKVAWVETPILMRHKRISKRWANNHFSWTVEQSQNILYHNKIWVSDGQYRRQKLTCKLRHIFYS